MKLSLSKLASYIVLAILLAICINIVYQLGFDSMQESFVSLSTYGDFIVHETEFRNFSDKIEYTAESAFPGVSIDNSLNSSMYYKRVNNEDLHFYNENEKYNWDSSTIQLYKDFLNSQNISISDEDFNGYVDKLRTIYNQYMILELMSNETNRHKLLTSGVLVDGSHNLLEPWDSSTMSLTGSQYIVKCNNNKLQKFASSSSSSVGTDISLSLLNGLSFPNAVCNPCDSLLAPGNEDRYKCKYDLNIQKNVGLSGNGIWNKIWNSLTYSESKSETSK
jgi:hypothetical protein|uniref:Uncharacterized protein n=1 Tax=viral metagenome TaxID=1070528 RepID=A0A6C0IL70_9ZZZZ